MTKLEKMAEKFVTEFYPRTKVTGLSDAIKNIYMAGYKKAREDAAAKIKASVDLSGIKNPSDSLVNCALQAKHDYDLCMKLGEEE